MLRGVHGARRAVAAAALGAGACLGVPGAGPDAAPVDASPLDVDPALVARWRFDDDPTDGVDEAGGDHPASCTTCPALERAAGRTYYAFTGAEPLHVPAA